MTGITREDVAKVIRSVIEDAVWSDDDRLDNVGVDGPCDLLAVADAVMLLLHAPARIDEAVAKERERCATCFAMHANILRGEAQTAPYGKRLLAAAEFAESLARAIRTPTPTTEEGA